MKKLIFILILTIYLIGVASALSVNIKDSYEKQETMIVKISGDIKEPITNDNILLKRGHVSVPLDYDIKKLGNDYYLWAVAPTNENNYTLWINDVVTMVSGNVNKSDFGYNFSVTGKLVDYYVKPGVIFSNKDFEISVFSNMDVPKEINVEFPEERNIVLNPGKNKLEFSISNVYGTQLINFSVGKYNVRAYIIGEKTGNEIDMTNATNVSKSNVYFVPQKIERELFSGEEETYPVTIVNDGDDLENISLEYNKDVFSINPEPPLNLASGKSFVFNLSMQTDRSVNESITLNTNNIKAYLNVKISISNRTTNKNETKKNLFYCDELGGNICKGNEECSIENVESLDGPCCKGKCIEKKEGGTSWAGYIIAVIAIILIIYIYYRYKSVKKEKNPLAKRIKRKNIP